MRIGIIGATGAVGTELRHILEECGIAITELRLFASERSSGLELPFRGRPYRVEELAKSLFAELDYAFFCVEPGIAREYAPEATRRGCVVIDNSLEFRHTVGVPLVVPEVNGRVLDDRCSRLIASPNCTTAIALMALAPLHDAFAGLRYVDGVAEQAVSGAGAGGIDELHYEIVEIVDGRGHAIEDAKTGGLRGKRLFPHQIAHNLIPCIGAAGPHGYSTEERRLADEGPRILGAPFEATLTCVRVPVPRVHMVHLTAHFGGPVSVAEARAALEAAEGVAVRDEPQRGIYPMPISADGMDDCQVGRIRLGFDPSGRTLKFTVAGDQLRRGAALNLVKIWLYLLRLA